MCPSYRFECPKCNNTKDVYSLIEDRNIVRTCSKCNTLMVRLIGSGGGFYLKGKDWYKPGYNK